MDVLAIDGPAGSGKSTVARSVAAELGLDHLDTGAMYRAVTAAALHAGLDGSDPAQHVAIVELARRLPAELDGGRVRIDGRDVTTEIRGPEVTAAVSAVAAIPAVREELVDQQRSWVAQRGGGVLEGRDIGTVVFPDARLKVYLTASSAVRAARRAGESTAGSDAVAVAADLERRDRHDTERDVAPLGSAADAVTIDTSDLDVDQVVAAVLAHWHAAAPTSPPASTPASTPSDTPSTADPSDPADHADHADTAVVPPDGSDTPSPAVGTAPAGRSDVALDADTATAPADGSAARQGTSARLDSAWNAEHPKLPARAFYAVCRAALVGLCFAWFRMEVSGKEHVPAEGGFILAPVHRSNLDTPIVASVTRRPLRFMGKDSMWHGNRFVAWVLSALGGFPVARGTADRDALRRCQTVLEQGQPLVLYPEGTRQFGPELHELYDGPAFLALRTGLPVIPVGIGGSERAQRKGSRLIRPAKVRVVVGPPIVPPAPTGRATSRRAVRELTETLRHDLQALFDQARAGLPT